MNWFEKHQLDLMYPNDAELKEVKFLIANATDNEKLKYDLWLSTLAGLYLRLDNRYVELSRGKYNG